MRRTVRAEVVAATFDRPPREHTALAEPAPAIDVFGTGTRRRCSPRPSGPW